MNKYDIEISIMNSIKEPIEDIIENCINTINDRGNNFEKDFSQVGIWLDSQKGIELNINTILSVSCKEISEQSISSKTAEQFEIENRFYDLAEEGKNEKAHILASFEGEIANGGFEQLFLNKDSGFIKQALEILQSIGAEKKHKLSQKAIKLLHSNSQTISNYYKVQRNLSAMDDQFDSIDENIPILYYQKYQA